MTIYLHETHRVIGKREDEFAARYRDDGGWMDVLSAGASARLLYFAQQVHGTGPSYRVVTITAVENGAAWEELAARLQFGDLAEWLRGTDQLRHDVEAKLLLPVPWSPLHDVDLAAEPTDPQDHEPSLFMEDTGWPDVPLDDYVEFWERDYMPMLHRAPVEQRLLEIQACWVPALGAGRRPEAILWQRVHNQKHLLGLLTTEITPAMKGPGSYMATALEYRDQWQSRLLRTASWSPRW